jgi:hypothetical protein
MNLSPALSIVAHWYFRANRMGPGLALGLYSGRILSEWLRPGLMGALVLTAVLVVIGYRLLQWRPLPAAWSVLLLLLYVFYPEPAPRVAASVAGLALLTWLLQTSWSEIASTTGVRLAPLPLNQRSAYHRPASWWLHAVLLSAPAIFFFVMYLATLAPDVLTADNGEFQLVATQLGVAHPPGFPLYTMLAHLMSRLPVGATPAYRINLFSAVTSLLTLLLVSLTLYRLTRSHLAGATAVLALGSSTTFWAQATTANVRSLAALFVALAVYFLLSAQFATPVAGVGPRSRWTIPPLSLFLAGLILSLAVSHHASLVFMAALFAVYLLRTTPELLWRPGRWWPLLLGGLLGLLPLLYLPWRAAAGAYNAPPDLVTLDGFLNHVLARGFRGDFFYFREAAVLWERLQVMANVVAFQFSPWLILGIAVGFGLLWRHAPRIAFLLGGSLAVHTLVTATYRAPQTVEYMMPAYVPAVLCLGYGVGLLRKRARQTKEPAIKAIAALAPAVLLLAGLVQTVDRFPSYLTLRHDTSTRDYAQRIFESAPPDTTVLANWHWVTPLWYLQAIEGRRPDLRIHFVYPTAEAYEVTWARRIDEERQLGRSVVATHYHAGAYADLPPPEPIGDAFLFRPAPRLNLPAGFQPAAFRVADRVEILGYRLEQDRVEIGSETAVTLAWQPLDAFDSSVTLFAHLVGADGSLYAQEDLAVRPHAQGMTLTRFRLVPRPGTQPGRYNIMVGAYGTPAPLNTAGEGQTALTGLSVVAMSRRPFSHNSVYRRMVPEPRPLPGQRPSILIGYDWDNSLPGQPRLYLHWQSELGYQTEVVDAPFHSFELPAWAGPWGITVWRSTLRNRATSFYVPFGDGIVWTGGRLDQEHLAPSAAPVSIKPLLRSSRPVTRDLVVSVRLIGYEADGFHWAWVDSSDGVPALGAIPTLKWIESSTVRDRHRLHVQPQARPGQLVGATLIIYDAFTGQPLPILDERIQQQWPWLPLGTAVIVDP